MTDTVRPARAAPGTRATHKGFVLFILGISQLMIVLDATIVNVALNDIFIDLHVASIADLQWIVTGYTLAFGGFLLLGGKLADRIGRKRVFIIGASLFALASLVGGLSNSLGMLIAARAFQGAGGALMAPAALSILTVVFSEGKERDRAFGVWAGISAGGAALGLVLGGILTSYASWRWVLFVNVPIAVLAIIGTLRAVPESKDEKAQGFDLVGSALVTLGLIVLVYGLVNANAYGWGSGRTLGTLAGALVLLVLFFFLQTRLRSPLLPLKLFRFRSLLGADLGGLLIASGLFSVFFFLVLWMQQVNHWSPIRSGLAVLPVTVFIAVGAGVSSFLLGKIGPRPLVFAGPLIGAVGLIFIGLQLEPDTSYVTILIGLIIFAIGLGVTFVSLTSAAVSGIPQENAGIASALLNAAQQVGGSVGLALLTAVSVAQTKSLSPPGGFVLGPTGQPVDPTQIPAFVSATVDGWGTGMVVGGCLLILAALIMVSLVRGGKGAVPTGVHMG